MATFLSTREITMSSCSGETIDKHNDKAGKNSILVNELTVATSFLLENISSSLSNNYVPLYNQDNFKYKLEEKPYFGS